MGSKTHIALWVSGGPTKNEDGHVGVDEKTGQMLCRRTVPERRDNIRLVCASVFVLSSRIVE